MKRIVTVDAAGTVISEWVGGEEQELPPAPSGQKRIDVTLMANISYHGKRWTGTKFVKIAIPTLTSPARSDRQVLDAIAAKLGV